MSYTIENVDTDPILIITIHEEYNVATDQAKSDAEVRPYLDNAQQPLYHIVDISNLKMSLDDIVSASNFGSRREDALWRHPMIATLVFVTPNKLAQAAAKGLGSVAFGNIPVKTFNTCDDALAWIQAELASTPEMT